MYLLDTSILSAPLKPKPDMKVLGWLREASKSRPYLSVVTIHESRFGFELLQEGRKRRDLEHWFEGEILPRFAGRILPITEAIGMNAVDCLRPRERQVLKPNSVMR
jgi:predicted nucleic acid-binding protein